MQLHQVGAATGGNTGALGARGASAVEDDSAPAQHEFRNGKLTRGRVYADTAVLRDTVDGRTTHRKLDVLLSQSGKRTGARLGP
jgi:hypothetical protein